MTSSYFYCKSDIFELQEAKKQQFAEIIIFITFHLITFQPKYTKQKTENSIQWKNVTFSYLPYEATYTPGI